MIDLIIPDACIPYIRYQHSRFNAEKVPDPQEAKRRYAALIYEYFLGMEPHFPKRVDTIIDVGCGLATNEVFIKRKFPHAHLTLLDGDTVTREGGGGYSDHPDVYNSRAMTELLLAANGVTVDRWYDVGTKELLEADLIISMASWGYHYPLATYRTRGLHIVDLRRGAEKQRGKVIFAGPKYDRCMWQQA